jgi:hypothetical protein
VPDRARRCCCSKQLTVSRGKPATLQAAVTSGPTVFDRQPVPTGTTACPAVVFDEKLPERFFVKNLEQVQGDERDAIILTVGVGMLRAAAWITAALVH